MSEDNNRRRNITGSYPGATGSYRSSSASKPEAPKPEREPVPVKKKKEFDFKLWFSQDNVKAFMRELRYYGIIVAVSLVLTGIIVSVANDVFAFIKPDESVIVTIAEGGSAKAAAKALKDAGVIEYKGLFTLWCKIRKADGTFKSGDYTFNKDYDYDRLISKLKRAPTDTKTVNITVAMGDTQDSVIEKLEAAELASLTELETAFNKAEYKEFEFVKEVKDRRCRLEGYIPAGEYEFFVGQSANSIVTEFLSRFEELVLTEENQKLIKDSKKTLDDIIITASLIEAECDNAEDYKTVASVISNRLASEQDNFLMLTGPINYILENKKQALTLDDKKSDSEYNTYMYSGLPAGPICSPSVEAISAVLSPETSDYLFFTSSGEETHFFSNETEHRKYVDKLKMFVKGTDTIK